MKPPIIADLDAEAAVISAELLASDTPELLAKCLEVAATLQSTDFCSVANQQVYGAIKDLRKAGRAVDIVVVAAVLRERGVLDQVGGTTYLAHLVDATPAVWNVQEHARSVLEKSLLRRSQQAFARLASEALEPMENVRGWLDAAQGRVFEVCSTEVETRRGRPLRDVVKSALDEARAAHHDPATFGTPTGIARLDRFTLGLRRGTLWTIAGRSGMGKTSLVTNIAENAAAKGHGVVFFSGEMGDVELAHRMLSRQIDVPAKRIAVGQLSADEWSRLNAAAQSRAPLPIIIDDSTPIAPSDIRLALRRHMVTLRAQGVEPRVVVVDYLQLFRAPSGRGGTRTDELGEFTGALKRMARELGVCVLALSQLNRDGKDGRPPVLTDLKDSSSIEQDSDVVIFVHRPGYFKDSDAAKNDREAVLIVAKGRGVGVGTIPVHWFASRTEFCDVAERFTTDPDWIEPS